MPGALVTGGNRGIGRAIVVALAHRGFDVAFVDMHETDDTAATLAAAGGHGRRIAFVRGDIGDLARHDAVLDAAERALGTIDALVNNAGVAQDVRGDLLDLSPATFDRTLDVNARGTFFLTQACARRMVARARPDTPRAIVTVTSVSATAASIERGAYCCSKAALSMMVKLFAIRLAPHGIACHEVRPGVIRTAMTAGVTEQYDRLIAAGGIPHARWGEPDDVARVVAALCAGDFPYMTGEAITVDGGLTLSRL